MAVTIPDTHKDLLDKPIHAVFTTIMPNGQPQSTLVWCDYNGEYVRVNTARERQKSKNLLANPKATLLIIDPDDSARFLEVRGEVEITEEGALEHADSLTRQYTNKRHFYGDIYSVEQQEKETRIICKIKPSKITRDAIHN